MPLEGGYLSWSSTAAENALQETPVIAGIQQVGIGITPGGVLAGGGTRIPKLDGRTVRHRTPGHPNQPLGRGPESLTLTTGEFNDIGDFRHLAQLAAQAAVDDVEVLMRLETVDEWLIEAGRALWTPTFKMAFGTAGTAGYSALPTPVVRVLDSANVVQSTLTVVSGAPSAGEVQIDETIDSQLLTTFAADLDGDAGDRLVVNYVPLLPVTLASSAWNRTTINILNATLELAVAPPDMDWSADTP